LIKVGDRPTIKVLINYGINDAFIKQLEMIMDILNKVEYYGSNKNWSGSLNRESSMNHSIDLKPCAFCQGTTQKIMNTHTPFYWIECQCGVEMHACYIGKDNCSYTDMDYGDPLDTKDKVIKAHEAAIKHIVNKWNARSCQHSENKRG